jgi:CMP-N-acetylneuraminic acid synthetase
VNFFILICARGGSKGLPKKNIKKLCGIPLIGWSIKIAKKVSSYSRIVVSTDNKEIADIAKNLGASVPFIRPKDLSQDKSPEWLVWKHAINFLQEEDSVNYDAILVIPPTAPLRDITDIENVIEAYSSSDCDGIITVSESSRNPHFNMVRLDKSDKCEIWDSPLNPIHRRQDAPVSYDITTVAYMFSTKFVLDHDSIFPGNIKGVKIPKERAIDIDDEVDFYMAEFLMNKKKQDASKK